MAESDDASQVETIQLLKCISTGDNAVTRALALKELEGRGFFIGNCGGHGEVLCFNDRCLECVKRDFGSDLPEFLVKEMGITGDELTMLHAGRDQGHTKCTDEQDSEYGLWDATPGCPGTVKPAPGGGIKCDTCNGWFCF